MSSVIDTLSVTVKFNIEPKDLELFVQCVEELDKVLKGGLASIQTEEPTFDQKTEFLEAKIAWLETELDSLYEEEECPCDLCFPKQLSSIYVSPEGVVYTNGACL